MKDRNREDPGCLLRGAVWEQQCYTIDISSTAMSQVSEGWTGNATVASGLGTWHRYPDPIQQVENESICNI